MKNRNIYLSLLVGWLLLCTACSPRKVYLSTSFHEPATDGLRFIYSYDGYHWDSIPGIWLEPAVGTQRVLRDPSLVQATDGVFHLVWTSRWRNDYGIGYASSGIWCIGRSSGISTLCKITIPLHTMCGLPNFFMSLLPENI